MNAWRTLASPVAALVLVVGGCGDNEEPSTGLTAGSVSNSTAGTESGTGNSSGNSVPTDPSGASEGATSSDQTTSPPSMSTGEPGTTSTSTTTTTGGNTTLPAGCGNGAIDPNEQCDGNNLNGFDCAALGAGTGTLLCDPATCTFDTSMCDGGGGGTSS